MKKWLFGTLAAVIITPLIAFSWSNLRSVWASPEKIASVEKRLDKADEEALKKAETQQQIAQLVLEQKARQDTQEAVSKAQMESMKEQLALIAELKKKK